MPAAVNDSSALRQLSPSMLEILRSCRLRMSWHHERRGSQRPQKTIAQVLGDVCHGVLEDLTIGGEIPGDQLEDALELYWRQRLVEAERDPSIQHLGPSGEWSGIKLRRARLHKAARRLHDLLRELPAGAELVSEAPMSAFDGRLYGRPDLVVRHSDAHWVIDFKTGPVRDRDSEAPKQSYARQLKLYALLEREASGSWPTLALLQPVGSAPLKIDIEPQECEALAQEALDLLEAYNATVPGRQPASPSPDVCRWCPFLAECEAVWRASSGWELMLARGPVLAIQRTALGGVTITVDSQAGSSRGQIVLRGVLASEHPAADVVKVGEIVAVAGGRSRGEASLTYALPSSARLTRAGDPR